MGILLLSIAAPSHAQGSRCGDCHIATPGAPAPRHVSAWDLSAHGRNNVGCEKCHGGDATTFESFQTHRGIVPFGNPSSPVERRNLPRTCGMCHSGQFVEFQRSRHYEVLRSGDTHAPTCTTCHDEVGAYLPSPKALEGECNRCHGPNKTAPRPEFAKQARLLLEGVNDVRASLKAAQSLIRRVKSRPRREEFERQYQQVQVPITEAVHAGHSFTFLRVDERLAVARERAGALLERLANPPKN